MKNNVWLKVFCVIAVVLFCSSCATTTRHAPENIPDEELAVIKTGSGVLIDGIDTESIKNSSSVYLEPGFHILSVHFNSGVAKSQGSNRLPLYTAKGAGWKIGVVKVGSYEIQYTLKLNGTTQTGFYNPMLQKEPVVTQEAIDNVRIYEYGPLIPNTPIANIKFEYGKPPLRAAPEFMDEINLFKQYAYDLGANAIFCYGKKSGMGMHTNGDIFSGVAVKIDGELPEGYMY